MKSYINVLEDYHNAPIDWHVTIPDPEEELERSLKSLTRSRKRTEETDVVERGTVTMLSVESEMEKFNKKMVPVTIGGGLYNLELEEQLIGEKVGETLVVTVMDKPVTVTIRSATKIVFPEPTDEDVKTYVEGKEEFEGIQTLEEYKKCVAVTYIEEQKFGAIQDKVQEIIDYVLDHSDLEFDHEELQGIYQQYLSEADADAKETCGKSYEEMTDEELQKNFGVGSREEFEQFLKEGVEQEVAFAMWATSQKGKDLSEVNLDDEELYDLSFVEEYVTENIRFDCEEQI